MGNVPPKLPLPPPRVATNKELLDEGVIVDVTTARDTEPRYLPVAGRVRNYVATCEYCSRREAGSVLYCQGCGALLPGDLPIAILSGPYPDRYDPDIIGKVYR